MSRQMFFCLTIALLVMFLGGCGPKKTEKTVIVEKVVQQTVEVEKIVQQTVEVMKVVQQTVVVEKDTQAPTVTEYVPPAPTVSTTPIQTPGSVAILVVDDFIIEATKGESAEPPDVVKKAENCIYTTEGEQGYASTGAQGYTSKGAQGYTSTGATIPLDENGVIIPHGRLVYNQIYKELQCRLGEPEEIKPGTEPTWDASIAVWHIPNKPKIYLVPVDTSDYKTLVVTERISNTIATLSGPPENIQRFVLNMSFVIMPCDLGYDDEGNPISTSNLLDAYLAMLEDMPELAALHTLLTGLSAQPNLDADPIARNLLLYGPDSGPARLLYFYGNEVAKMKTDSYVPFVNDPMYIWLNELQTDPNKRVISVAAAGNFGHQIFDFPFAPGVWDSVVSVSASGWDPLNEEQLAAGFDPTVTYPTTITAYSNNGEVMFDGHLSQDIIKDNLYYSDFSKAPDHEGYVDYFGTSFAAPRLSVEEAFYLFHGGEVSCVGSTQRSCQPPLGYSEGHGSWRNLLIGDAISRYCSNFWGP
jgi:hypothetical protein